MKYVKYVFKLLFLIYVVGVLAADNKCTPSDIVLLLLILAVNVVKERYFDSLLMVILDILIITAGIFLVDGIYIILFCPAAFDLMNKKAYPFLLPLLVGEYLLDPGGDNYEILLLTAVCGLFGFMMITAEEKENSSLASLDEERRLRYDLESAKAKLLASAKEIGYLAEVKERNRIAREIHDNVGHRIAGILIQLQAAAKLFDLDREKSAGMLDKSIAGLSDAVSILRDTVHNIKPQENLGIEYIRGIVSNFSFCEVDFRYSGDFSKLPSEHMEILASGIREALTNAAKHSKATRIEISAELNEKYLRLLIKDNGVGCGRIKEGLGLSGMRERAENLGGCLSVSSEKGFMIVCLIPLERVEGGVPVENSHSG